MINNLKINSARLNRRRYHQKNYRPRSGPIALVVMAGVFILTENDDVVATFNSWVPPYDQTNTRPERSTRDQSIIRGHARVVDGDTIKIHGKRIRLFGIDAPESKQYCKDSRDRRVRCGAVATALLRKFLQQSSPTKCVVKGKDQYGRILGDCFRSDGVGVAQKLVSAGHALDWPKYSNGAYARAQTIARSGRLGIWSGEFERPWDYRRYNR